MITFSFLAWSLIVCQMDTTTTAPVHEPYRWDFSESRHVSRVPWPEGQRPKPDIFHHLTVNQKVRAKIDSEHVFERYVRMVTFSRSSDQLSYIAFDFEHQSAADLYATAIKLAEEWKLPSKRLVAWKNAVAEGRDETALIMRSDLSPTPAIEIFKSFNETRPYRIVFTISWFPERKSEAPGTKPVAATLPTKEL